jgi:hypothetical protein
VTCAGGILVPRRSDRGTGAGATVLARLNKQVLAMLDPPTPWARLRVAARPPQRGVVDPRCAPWRDGGVGTKGVPPIDARSPRGVEPRAVADERRMSPGDDQPVDLTVAREGGRPTPRLRSTAARRR